MCVLVSGDLGTTLDAFVHLTCVLSVSIKYNFLKENFKLEKKRRMSKVYPKQNIITLLRLWIIFLPKI